MEDFDFSTEQNNTGIEQKNVQKEISGMQNVSDSSQTADDGAPNPQNNIVNTKQNIAPQIPNDEAPFIVLCGPPSSGKTMVLKCLASHLYGSRHSIMANRTLLNTPEYQENCNLFESIIGETNTPMPNTVNYLMADILDNLGNVKAHFLEAPGEDFFSLTDTASEPNRQFKGYMDQVAQITTGNPRKVIYIIILDLDSTISLRNDPNTRIKYEQKMERLYSNYVLNHPSRVILLYNKVDKAQNGLWANANGCFNHKAILNDAKRNYPNLFFTRKFLFWDIDNYKFLPFCTGSYPDDGTYTAAGPTYSETLWKEISKLW